MTPCDETSLHNLFFFGTLPISFALPLIACGNSVQYVVRVLC